MKHRHLLLAAALCIAPPILSSSAQAPLAPINSSSGVGQGADAEFIRAKGAKPNVLDFTVDEATMAGLSVSPKGDSVIFDLLGHIYRLPINGGAAESLTQASGIAVNAHPRFSPDGNRIVFVSDRGGQDNLWVMNADGSNARILYNDGFMRFTDPAWSPDGKTIVAVRNLASPGRGWHRRTWALALVPANGGKPRELLAGTSDQYYAPTYSPDGRYIYFHSAVMAFRGLSIFQYHQKIKRIELATGKIETMTTPELPDTTKDKIDTPWVMAYHELPERSPAELEPHPDPSGRYIAYAKEMPEGNTFFRRHHLKGTTALVLLDTQTRTEKVLVDPVTRDVTRSHAYYVDTQMPGHDWTPDGKSVLFWRDGHLWKVDVATNAVTRIPFSARYQRTVSELVKPKLNAANAVNFTPRLYLWPALSPDKRTLVFGAIGRLWRKDMSGAADATPLIAGDGKGPAEITPAWSPDGTKLAFATWHDEKLGALNVLDAASGKVVQSCAGPTAFIHPRWEKSGTLVVTARTVAPTEGSPWDGGSWELRRINMGTCAQDRITQLVFNQPAQIMSDGRISFTRQSRSKNPMVFMEPFPGEDTTSRTFEVITVAPDGGNERRHALFPPRSGAGNSPMLMPDGKSVLFESGQRLFHQKLSEKPSDNQVSQSSRPANSKLLQHRLASDEVPGLLRMALASEPRPTRSPSDNERVISVQPNDMPRGRTRLDPNGFSSASSFSPTEVQLISGNRFVLFNTATGRKTETLLRVTVPNEPAPGRLALMNAKIITMEGTQVIEKGNIIVEKGKLLCVGECQPAAGDTVMNMDGKTIIPGLIDMHAHIVSSEGADDGVAMRRHMRLSIALGYGVTTVRDPSGSNTGHALLRDLTETGYVLGPRTYGTGKVVSEGGFIGLGDHVRIDNMEDARYHVSSRLALGIESLKNFRVANRKKHQYLIEAAREHNMPVTAEGASPILALGFAMDGQTGWEHAIAALPLHKDMTTFFAMTGVTHSPTMTIIGWPDGTQTYFRPYAHLEKDPMYTYVASKSFINGRNARSMVEQPKERFWHPVYAESSADIQRAGGYVTSGEHGEQPGIGTHWDIWTFADAMTEIEALYTATVAGAHFLGAEDQIGSLKAGKLADLVVLNSDPLRNIRNTTDIAYVMTDGRLLQRSTLDQVWPQKVPMGFRPWSRDSYDKP